MRAWLSAFVLAVSPIAAVAVDLDGFARCLAVRGVVFYGAEWCPHCRAQERMFGSAFRHVPYVECSEAGSQADRDACRDARVSTFPTWIVRNRGRVTGKVTLEQLAGLSGCPLGGRGGSRFPSAARGRGGVTDLSGSGVEVVEVPRAPSRGCR